MFRYFAGAVKTQQKRKSDFILAVREKSGKLYKAKFDNNGTDYD